MTKNKLSAAFFLNLFLLALLPCTLFAASFDQSLNKISALRKDKKNAELASMLDKTSASAELEDLRLFLLAESRRATGDKDNALKHYETLLSRFPERETSFQARLPHFLLLLEQADESLLPKLEGMARSLPTAWQRGTAFEKMSALSFLKPAKKGRFALAAVREHHSDKPFYKTIPASHDLIKKMLADIDGFVLTDDEWVEVLRFASEEGITKDFFARNYQKHLGITGKWGPAILEVFRAVNLQQQSKSKEAAALLNRIIADGKTPASVRAFAHQERAYIHYQTKDFISAVNDYRKALENPAFPVNGRACQYRLMRSAFSAGRDAEALESLNQLLKGQNHEPLLPIHLYEMALERFDYNLKQNSVPFFMAMARNFPGHYRADDALGYAVMASGRDSEDGKTLLKLLEAKYVNSFFITWIAPELQNKPLKAKAYKHKAVSAETASRVKAWKKLWKTDFATFAREEARKLTDKFPANLGLYKEIVDVCRQNEDYNQMTAYGERLARQLLEAGKSLGEMPLWAWQAFYPEAYSKLIETQAKANAIDPHWVLSIMREESHFNPETLSRSNAHGLMQILPSTGKWIADKLGHKPFDKKHLWKPEVNIRFGCWYLKYLADLFKGDLHLASAAYNGGQGNIQRKVEQGPFANLPVLERLDRVPLPETRDYYKKVMGSYWNYRRLYK